MKRNTKGLSLSPHTPASSSLSCNMSTGRLLDRANGGATVYQETNCQIFSPRETLFNVFSSCQDIIIFHDFLSIAEHLISRLSTGMVFPSVINSLISASGCCASHMLTLCSVSPMHTHACQRKDTVTQLCFLCNTNTVNTDAACDAGLRLLLFHAAASLFGGQINRFYYHTAKFLNFNIEIN